MCARNSSARSFSSCFLESHHRIQRFIALLLRAHYAGHSLHEKLPLSFFQRELLFAFRCKLVELCALIVLGYSPLGFDPALAPQPMERRIEAPMLHLQEIVGLGADDLSDAVPVLRSPLQSAEDKQIESALQDVEFAGGHVVESLPLSGTGDWSQRC